MDHESVEVAKFPQFIMRTVAIVSSPLRHWSSWGTQNRARASPRVIRTAWLRSCQNRDTHTVIDLLLMIYVWLIIRSVEVNELNIIDSDVVTTFVCSQTTYSKCAIRYLFINHSHVCPMSGSIFTFQKRKSKECSEFKLIKMLFETYKLVGAVQRFHKTLATI